MSAGAAEGAPLPPGWIQATIGELADTKLGKMLDAAKNRGELVPYLRNVNVRWGAFDVSDLLEMRVTPEEHEELAVQEGDLFLCEGGEPGRCAVWRGGERNLVFQKALHRVRPFRGVEADYLASYIAHVSSSGGLNHLFTGTTIKHLPQVALKRVTLPLPPSTEQRRIVAKLHALGASLARARAELDRVAALGGPTQGVSLLGRLESAILTRAFRGELVPQDPNDEPASILLERVRAQRAAAPKPKRGRSAKADA